ncbi:hypothetical protein GOODEAATRI_000733, partial [Goodea atripinnis]
VRLRLTGVHTGWSGALRFGFTSLDPSDLEAADIPKYACPDLVTRPGYWAKALPERLALKDNVLSFWADRHGRVFYSINDGEPILFHCGLSIGCPLWAIIDIYGITQEVTLLAACIHFLDSSRTLVFSDRPLHVGETLYVEVGHLGLPYFGAMSFGLTSCDPACLHSVDLPADPEVLLDRKEYWVLHRGFPMPCSGDVLSFSLLPSGEVHHGVNGAGRGRLLCVDSSQVLWAFFTLHGAVNRLRILGHQSELQSVRLMISVFVELGPQNTEIVLGGTLQSSPPCTSPTTSQSSSPDDSDSDLAFSINRSSSASESSLGMMPDVDSMNCAMQYI